MKILNKKNFAEAFLKQARYPSEIRPLYFDFPADFLNYVFISFSSQIMLENIELQCSVPLSEMCQFLKLFVEMQCRCLKRPNLGGYTNIRIARFL